MICFWESTFWAKTSLFFIFRGPNTVNSEVVRSDVHNGTSFKAVWWSISEKTHFGLKHPFLLYLEYQIQFTLRFSGLMITMAQVSKLYDDPFLKKKIWDKSSLFFVFRGPKSVYPEVFRCDDHNGTSFKAVWWSISEKTHFGLKHHFSLYLEYQIQFTLRFSGVMITVVQVSKLYDEPLLKKTTFWAKASLFFVFSGPNSVHSQVFRCDDHNGTSFKAVWSSTSEKNTFWEKTSLSFIVRGPILVHSEVFRCDDHNGTSFKAVWWSISEKTHFGLKHHFFRSDVHNGTSFKAVWWSISEKTHFGLKHPFLLYFRVPNSVYPEVFRSDDHNGTSFKAV